MNMCKPKTTYASWLVQAQTRSVGAWSVVLVTGRSGAASCPSFHCSPSLLPQQWLVIHSQITHCKYTRSLHITPLHYLYLAITHRSHGRQHATLATTYLPQSSSSGGAGV